MNTDLKVMAIIEGRAQTISIYRRMLRNGTRKSKN